MNNLQPTITGGHFVFYEELVAIVHSANSDHMNNHSRITANEALLNKDKPDTNKAIKKESMPKIREDGLYDALHNVYLSPEKIMNLFKKISDSYEGMIEDLSFYIGSKGDRYKSHYGTILSWDRMQRKKAQKGFEEYNSYKGNK